MLAQETAIFDFAGRIAFGGVPIGEREERG